MGNNAKYRTQLVNAGAQSSLDAAEYERMFSEDLLGSMEALLGTDAQAAGTGEFATGGPAGAQYMGEYVLNPQGAQALNQYYLDTGGSKLNKKLAHMERKLGKLDVKNPEKADKIRAKLAASRAKHGGTLGEGGGGGLSGIESLIPGLNLVSGSVSVEGLAQAFDPAMYHVFKAFGIFDNNAPLYEQIAKLEAKVKGTSTADLEGIVGQMNELNQQALAAAQAGDLDKAEELGRAIKAMEGFVRARGAEGSVGDLIGFQASQAGIEAQAAAKLANPQARIVGGLVKQGREFLDPNSETSERFKGALTDRAIEAVDLGLQNAERGLASASAGAQRQMRDLGLARGSARSPMAQMAIAARSQQAFGAQRAQLATQAAQQRAQILGEADKFFEQYSRQFAQNSAAFAQSWLQGQSGVRESFNIQMQNLKTLSAQVALNAAGIEAQFALQKNELDAAETSNWIGLGSSIGGSLLGAAGSIGGAAMLCWVAALFWPWGSPAWQDARRGVLRTWPRWALYLYAGHGKLVARVARRFAPLRWALRPLFERARRAGSR